MTQQIGIATYVSKVRSTLECGSLLPLLTASLLAGMAGCSQGRLAG